VIFCTEKFYCNSVHKIQIDKNIRHFTRDRVLLLEETALGKNIVNILAQGRTITNKGCFCIAQGEKGATVARVHAPIYFVVFRFLQAVVKRQSCPP
jgi:hypothetical protein